MISTSDIIKKQNELNIDILGENWIGKKANWKYAIFQEVSELIESLNLAWWKDTNIDIKDAIDYKTYLKYTKSMDTLNIHIELVDIFHFLVSYYIEKYGFDVTEELIDKYKEYAVKKHNYNTVDTKLRIFASAKHVVQTLSWKHFFQLCYFARLNYKDLYKLYIGKQVLNKFRQDYGYKHGKYNKIWGKLEDNIVMYRFVLSGDDSITDEDIYNFLKTNYKG